MPHPRFLVVGAGCALIVGLTVTSAVAATSSDAVADNQACDTPPGGSATCFSGPTAIQAAVSNDPGGGTVNVGKGTFSSVIIATDGLTLNGSGQGTVIAGTISDSGTSSTPPCSSSLICAYKNSPGFAHPLRIQNFALLGTVPSGTRGSEITLKDQNMNNLDTITNNWFKVSSTSQGSIRGLYSYNSYAPLVLNRNTFTHTQYGALLETGGGTGTTFFASNTITGNLFDHLVKAPSAPSAGVTAIAVSIDNPGPTTSGGQDYSGNSFVYDDNVINATGLDVYGHGSPSNNGLATTIQFHSNNLNHVDLGVINETTSGPISATDTFWGCAQGPDVNPAPGTGTNACADADSANPAVTYTNPFLTGPAHLEEVGAS